MQVRDCKQLFALLASLSGKSISRAAVEMDHNNQWLFSRIKTEKFSLEEWKELCDKFGFDFEIRITDRNSDAVVRWTGK